MPGHDAVTTRILEGPLARELARFGTPLAVGMALQTTFNLVDAYLVARLPANEANAAIGALGICDQVAAIGTILSYGISTATGALLSHKKGAGDEKGIQHTAWQSLLVVFGLGVFFGLVGLTLSGPIVRNVIGAKGDVAEMATRYLRVIVGGSFSISFLLQLTSMQRALGSAKTPVTLLVLGNIVNVFLAILFMYGPGPTPAPFGWASAIARALHIPRLGMMGAGWATILARTATLVPIAILLARRFRLVLPPRGDRGFDPREVRNIVSVAWPSSAQFVIRIAAMLLVNSLVARFFTTPTDQTATTAMGLVFRLDTMALFVAMGWGSAAQTFVGQNLGARNEQRAQKSGWLTAAYDAGTNLLLIALLFWQGERILLIFDQDSAPVHLALLYLQTVAPSYLGLGLGIVLGNAMAGAGATRTTMWIDIAVIVGFQFPLCIAAVAFFGVELETLYRCVAITNTISGLVYAVVYGRKQWQRGHAALNSTCRAQVPKSHPS